MVAFPSEKDVPEPGSIEKLRAFVQDLDAFDLSNIMRDLQGHIVNPEREHGLLPHHRGVRTCSKIHLARVQGSARHLP